MENEESQKLQARTLDASTAPHCKHVFVTGVLRCGRFHSGEEGTSREYHAAGKSTRIEETDVAKQAAGTQVADGRGQASSCWESMSRLKAIRRSSATAAK